MAAIKQQPGLSFSGDIFMKLARNQFFFLDNGQRCNEKCLLYTGKTIMDIGPKLTGVEMAPYPLVTVIIDRSLLSAFGATPLRPRKILYQDIHPPGSRIKLDFGYGPRKSHCWYNSVLRIGILLH
jgi:hypothetical protein